MTLITDIPQPPQRDPSLPYEQVGDGLYSDETLVKLDTGEFVAVSVRADRIPTSGGTLVTAWARWCDENGKTILDPAGEEVENEHRHNFSPQDIERDGLDELSKQVVLAVLGEANTLMLSDELIYSVNIRNDIAVCAKVCEQKSAGDFLS